MMACALFVVRAGCARFAAEAGVAAPDQRQERLFVPVPCTRARSADMRYTGGVSNAFVESMAHNFEQALRLMEAALTDCPDELWQTDLWPDEVPTAPTPHGGLHGSAPCFLG
jgi:hypothetical protein